MRRVDVVGSVGALFLLSACATSDAIQEQTASFAEVLEADTEIVEARDDAVRSDNGLRLLRIAKFERQAMSLYYDEPLRLGPLSSAILKVLPVNMVGQLAAQRFYAFVESDKATYHRDQAEKIALAMALGRNGTLEAPFRAHSVAEARAFVIHDGNQPIGSIYAASEEFPLMVRISVLREGESVEHQYFEVFPVLNVAELFRQQPKFAQEARGPGPIVLETLVRLGDVTARVTIGQLLVSNGQINDALRVLDRANASDNLLVDLLMARAYRALALKSEEERMERNLQSAYHYRQAATSGYDSAMFELALLNLSGALGEDAKHDGIEILERAAGVGNSNAMFHLALHLVGGVLWQPDAERAKTLLDAVLQEPPTIEHRQVANELLFSPAHGDGEEEIQLVDYFSPPERRQAVRDFALEWLRETAKNDLEAMVMLAGQFARGIHVRQDFRKSRALFRKAARRDPGNSELVNSIAWTLTVTHHQRLRDPRYALKIMDTMMSKDENAVSEPAYIDTLAAIHAALGDFEKAVTLQRKAIEYASTEDFPEELRQELGEHMDAFMKRQTVIDPVP